MLRQIHPADKIQETVEPLSTDSLEPTTPSSLLHTIYHVALFALHLFHKTQKPFWLFFEISINQKHPLSTGIGKPRHHRLVMTEISRQVYDNNMAIAFGKLYGQIEASVWRSIIHQNNFVVVADELPGHSTGSLMELGNVGGRLI